VDEQIVRFYDHFASDYHLIMADWEQSVRQQGVVLDRLITAASAGRARSVLDCSCGIGTQALGLAAHGYRVHATDLSPGAIARARREATAFGVTLTFGVADFRLLQTQVAGHFDVVLSCDNAVAHLLDEADLHQTARSMWSKLAPSGLLLLSVRDYDALLDEQPRATPVRVFDSPAGQRAVFQVWDWAPDGRRYTMHQFILRKAEAVWQTTHYMTQLQALRRADVHAILDDAGFVDIAWQMPTESGYYQPIVLARKGRRLA
jgi:2-polyprenyl-3-methyl-5-hydroxy-6-metoxy-1,4-benzoquinol methylase